VAGITLWLVVWWVTEAVSIYATALLPLALFPITGVLSLRVVGAEYMSPIIILLLRMFLVVLAVEKSGLQRKIAFGIISIFGWTQENNTWFYDLYGFNFHCYYEHFGSYFDYSNGFRYFILAI
jgi:hypothetical protein